MKASILDQAYVVGFGFRSDANEFRRGIGAALHQILRINVSVISETENKLGTIVVVKRSERSCVEK